MKCPYCSAITPIPPAPDFVQELDYRSALTEQFQQHETVETLSVRCTGCGASSVFPPNISATRCPFCGSAIVAGAESRRLIKPRSLLPFAVPRQHADGAFRAWLSSLWFAPSGLSQAAEAGSLTGVYLPFWTYDADTRTRYTGERGEDYWETETYTEMVDGKPETRTRQVQRTRWWPVSGSVDVPFDDILIPGARSLPQKQLNKLEPWDLAQLHPYQDEYLAGFVAQVYEVPLEEGFETAKQIMAGPIEQAICQDIGGDHQRVGSVDTAYGAVTFKHILLPVWLSAYRYQANTYRFLVNARTGEVQGERPYSFAKIALAVLFALVAIAIIALMIRGR